MDILHFAAPRRLVPVTFTLNIKMLTIEFEPPRQTEPCPCCGGATYALTRYVYKDGDAYAVYLVQYSENHPDRIVSVTIGMGEWGDGSSPDQRVSFAVELRNGNDSFQVMVVDPERSPWRSASFLGRMLTRQEALSHPLIGDIFHLTDHIVSDDEPINRYLEAH